MNFWICKGKPTNDFVSMLKPGDKGRWWTTKRPKDLAKDDGVFIWESSPKKRIVGISKITRPDCGAANGKDRFEQQYLTRRLPYALTIEELRKIPFLDEAVFLKAGPARVFSKLDSKEAAILLSLIRFKNPNELSPDALSSLDLSYDQEVPSLTDAFEVIGIEGGHKLFTHFVVERDRSVVRAKKLSVLQLTGKLACEVCSFDFLQKYGTVGEGFCEVPHKTQLSSLSGRNETKLDDLAIVCCNCHRMIHKSKSLLSIAELKLLIAQSPQGVSQSN